MDEDCAESDELCRYCWCSKLTSAAEIYRIDPDPPDKGFFAVQTTEPCDRCDAPNGVRLACTFHLRRQGFRIVDWDTSSKTYCLNCWRHFFRDKTGRRRGRRRRRGQTNAFRRPGIAEIDIFDWAHVMTGHETATVSIESGPMRPPTGRAIFSNARFWFYLATGDPSERFDVLLISHCPTKNRLLVSFDQKASVVVDARKAHLIRAPWTLLRLAAVLHVFPFSEMEDTWTLKRIPRLPARPPFVRWIRPPFMNPFNLHV